MPGVSVSSIAGSNTGRGLIVVEVVRESVPDYPVVTDTVLTAETREDAASELREWIVHYDIHTLNVAGPRESEAPGMYQDVRASFEDALRR